MRKLVVSEFVSIDGVMEAPGGEPGYAHSGWVIDFMGPEQIQYKLDEVLEAESQLIGRVTYESFADAWPQRDGVFADRMNSMPKHVVSTSLRDPAWANCTVISSDVVGAIQRLRDGEGGPILVPGSRTLVHTLFEHDLVDELRLMVMPVILGSGRRLYPETPRKNALRLIDERAFSTGVVVLTYGRASSAGAAPEDPEIAIRAGLRSASA